MSRWHQQQSLTRVEKAWDGSSSITLATTSRLWRRYLCHSVCCYSYQMKEKFRRWSERSCTINIIHFKYMYLGLTSSSRVSSSSSSNWAWLYLNCMRFRTSLKRRTKASLYLSTQIYFNKWNENKWTTIHQTFQTLGCLYFLKLHRIILSSLGISEKHWGVKKIKRFSERLTYLKHFPCQQVCFWFWLLESPKRHSICPNRQSSLRGWAEKNYEKLVL